MVKFEGVKKSFGSHTIIKNLNLEIPRGKFIVLIGPSGCGKTTTLKMINRLVEPSEGSIFVDGQNISDINPVELRRQIGYVIQQIGLFPNMTIEQNIEVVPKLLKWPKEKRRERVEELLSLVDMNPDDYMGRYPSELSGGQQQRIGVLRALAVSPPLILMDEPFSALDPITRDSLQDEVKRLQRKLGITIVFVTHDIDEAVKIADTIILMKDGRIVQAASPDELLTNPANDFVREFIGKKRLRSNYDVDLVKEIMNNKALTAYKSRGISESIALMRKRNVDSLIVVDDENRYEGIATIEDIRDARDKNAKLVGDLNISKAPTINVNAQAREAFETLIREKVPFLIAVDNKQRVRGIVTKTSMVKALAEAVWKDDDDE